MYREIRLLQVVRGPKRAVKDEDIRRPCLGGIGRAGDKRIPVAGRDEDGDGPKHFELLPQEGEGASGNAILVEEVPRNEDGIGGPFHGAAHDRVQGLAQVLAAPIAETWGRDVSGEGGVEVKVGCVNQSHGESVRFRFG